MIFKLLLLWVLSIIKAMRIKLCMHKNKVDVCIILYQMIIYTIGQRYHVQIGKHSTCMYVCIWHKGDTHCLYKLLLF